MAVILLGKSFLFYKQNAMAPKKRAGEDGERTIETRKAMRFSYSELDEDQGI